jgi:hypothetical protein
MVTRKGETSELVTMGHIRSHGWVSLDRYPAVYVRDAETIQAALGY